MGNILKLRRNDSPPISEDLLPRSVESHVHTRNARIEGAPKAIASQHQWKGQLIGGEKANHSAESIQP